MVPDIIYFLLRRDRLAGRSVIVAQRVRVVIRQCRPVQLSCICRFGWDGSCDGAAATVQLQADPSPYSPLCIARDLMAF